MKRYSNRGRDPFWTVAKWDGKCAKCGEPIKAGDDIFYYPNTRSVYSGKCADAAHRDFESCAADEAAYNGEY